MSKNKYFSVGDQVVFAFGTLCFIFLVIGGLHFISFQVIGRRDQKEARALKISASINHSAQNLERMEAGALRQLLATNVAEMKLVDQSIRDLKQTDDNNLASYVSFMGSERERQLYQNMMRARNVYWENTVSVLGFGLVNRDAEATELLIRNQSPLYGAYLKAINDLHDYIEKSADEITTATNRLISKIGILGNILGAIALSIIIGAGFTVTGITRRLKTENVILQNEISERRRVEEHLRQTDEKLGQVLENIADVFYVTSPDLQQLHFVSQGYESIFRRPMAEAYAHPTEWVETILPEDREKVVAAFAKLAAGEEKAIMEYRIRRTDGAVRWILSRGFGVRDIAGKVIRITGIASDITERKQIEDQIRESNRLAQSTIDALSANICVLDEKGAILATNLAWRQFADANASVTSKLQAGNNYLEVCDAVTGPDAADAAAFAAGIRGVAGGELANFTRTYACHSLSEKRWFVAQVTRFPGEGPVRVVVAHENITARQLANSERDRLMRLIEQSPDFIALAEMEGKITFVNEGGRRMVGLAPEEDPGTLHLTNYVPEAWREFFHETVLGTALKEGIWRGEMQLRHLQTGSLIDVYRTVFVIADPIDQKTLFATVTQDITKRKRIERELRENTERMRIQTCALEAAANGVVITDRRGTIQWVNAAFTRLTGYLATEVLGQNPSILKSGQHAGSFYKELWSTISSGKVWTGELANRRKNGQLYFEEMTITPVVDAGGSITHFIAVKQDISERKRIEEALRYKTALFEALVESAPDGILVVDDQGNQLIRNDRFMKLWKIPDHIAVDREDRRALEYVTGQNKNPAQFLAKIDFLYSHPREISRDELELTDGRVFDRYSSPVSVKEGKYYGRIWTFRDITDRKNAEASMQEMHEKLVTASREAGKSEVATSVLHNVGNVLNSVCVSCSCVMNELKNSKVAYLTKVVTLLNEHGSDLGAYLTNDIKGKRIPSYLSELSEHLILEQASFLEEMGRLQNNLEHIKDIVGMQQCYATVSGVSRTVRIQDLIDEALRMAFSSSHRHDVQILREFAPNLPEINLDKYKALQILVNLMCNAKEACDVTGQAEKLLKIRASTDDNRLRVDIVDNGIGIPEQNLTRIFNHGFTTKKDGHGFALHSSALAANEMGGSLIAQSDGPGLGSIFTLELPLPETTIS